MIALATLIHGVPGPENAVENACFPAAIQMLTQGLPLGRQSPKLRALIETACL